MLNIYIYIYITSLFHVHLTSALGLTCRSSGVDSSSFHCTLKPVTNSLSSVGTESICGWSWIGSWEIYGSEPPFFCAPKIGLSCRFPDLWDCWKMLKDCSSFIEHIQSWIWELTWMNHCIDLRRIQGPNPGDGDFLDPLPTTNGNGHGSPDTGL